MKKVLLPLAVLALMSFGAQAQKAKKSKPTITTEQQQQAPDPNASMQPAAPATEPQKLSNGGNAEQLAKPDPALQTSPATPAAPATPATPEAAPAK